MKLNFAAEAGAVSEAQTSQIAALEPDCDALIACAHPQIREVD